MESHSGYFKGVENRKLRLVTILNYNYKIFTFHSGSHYNILSGWNGCSFTGGMCKGPDCDPEMVFELRGNGLNVRAYSRSLLLAGCFHNIPSAGLVRDQYQVVFSGQGRFDGLIEYRSHYSVSARRRILCILCIRTPTLKVNRFGISRPPRQARNCSSKYPNAFYLL